MTPSEMSLHIHRLKSALRKFRFSKENEDDLIQESLIMINMRRKDPVYYRNVVIDAIRRVLGDNRGVSTRRKPGDAMNGNRRSAEPLSTIIDDTPRADDALNARQEASEALSKTDRIKRAILMLHYIYDFDQREIADLFNYNPARVSHLITEAKIEIRRNSPSL